MVRLYRSPSPGKRRFIENESDISATRSPICGAAVLGKITRKSNSNNNSQTTSNVNIQPVGERPQSDIVPLNQQKRSIFGSVGISYESIEDSPTFSGGRKSPESTESSTSGASTRDEDEVDDKQRKEDLAPGYALQFEPEAKEPTTTEESDEPASSDRQKLRIDRLQAWMEQQSKGGSQQQPVPQQTQGFMSIRNRANFWSTNLPVVTEERSFEAEDSSITSAGQSLKDDSDSVKNVRSYSSPERNEMLLAMRHLVLKQQGALSEMAEENRLYRRELQECRKLLQLAKEAYTRQQQQVESFMVEKESAEAEVLWLREEVKTLRTEIYKHQQESKSTWTASRPNEQIEERLQKAGAETPERRRKVVTDEATPAPSPVSTPVQSPVISPNKSWTLKSMLSEITYLSDEGETEEDLVKGFRDLRSKFEGTGTSNAKVEEKPRQQVNKPSNNESRDDSGSLSPMIYQQEDDSTGGPEDELREWNRSRSPNRLNSWQSQETRGRSRQPVNGSAVRESSRTPSEISTASSVSGASSAASQRSREEVALFKNRLEAIQKKREHRKHIEENVGSRSGRVRFT